MTTVTARPDTHDMLVVHRVFRRESGLLPGLVRGVATGDTTRAGVLTEHIRDYQLGLHGHHSGEDELVWPLLLARVDLEAELVLRMEVQHERISATLDRVTGLLPTWERSAAAAEREALATALDEHRSALLEHLADEENHILSVIEEYLTVEEWGRLGQRFATETPRDKLLFFLGAILEEATGAEAAEILANLPWPARMIWFTVGRRRYARQVRRVRGTSAG